MAEKKNDATSILAKIRQKMNKIDQSDDEVNLDNNIQDLLPSLDIEDYQSSNQTSSIKNEKIPEKDNLKSEDYDIFDDSSSEEDKSSNNDETNSDLDLDKLLSSENSSEIIPKPVKTLTKKDDQDIFNDEDLKLDIDLENKDEDKSKKVQEKQTEDDFDNINLEELEESHNEIKKEPTLNIKQEKFDDIDNLSVNSKDQLASAKQNFHSDISKEEDDILNFDFLEVEEKQPTILSENKTQSTFNKTELHELDELDDFNIDDLSKIEKPITEKQAPTHNSLNLEKEKFSKKDSDENDNNFFEEEIDDNKEDDEKISNQSQQSYQQQSKPDMISKKVMDEAQQSIKKLVQAVPKKQEMLFERSPAFRSGETIEDIVISMLRPKLEQWFNENLPMMVEKIVREEIKKIIPKHED